MCSGVMKSGSPRLEAETLTPWALSWRALAAAARVADGCTAAAILDMPMVILIALRFLRGRSGWLIASQAHHESIALYRIDYRGARVPPSCEWRTSSTAI